LIFGWSYLKAEVYGRLFLAGRSGGQLRAKKKLFRQSEELFINRIILSSFWSDLSFTRLAWWSWHLFLYCKICNI